MHLNGEFAENLATKVILQKIYRSILSRCIQKQGTNVTLQSVCKSQGLLSRDVWTYSRLTYLGWLCKSASSGLHFPCKYRYPVWSSRKLGESSNFFIGRAINMNGNNKYQLAERTKEWISTAQGTNQTWTNDVPEMRMKTNVVHTTN